MASRDSANAVDELARASRVDFILECDEIDLLQVIPELRVLGKDVGIVTRSASRQAFLQAQSLRWRQPDARCSHR